MSENTNENLDVINEEIDNIEAGGEEEDTPEEEVEEEPTEETPEDEEPEDEDIDPNDPMAKFKGKTTEEVIDMYKNLESTMPSKIAKEATKKAQELLNKSGDERPKGKGKTDDEILQEIEDLDFSKMKPKDFAKKMVSWIDKRALKQAQQIFDRQTKVRSSVSKEVKEAVKSFPQLKENNAYRELVISQIESAASRGDTISLKEACEKVNKALGVEKKKEQPKTKKRTGIERPSGTDADPNKTEEDKLKDSLMGGGKSNSGLGGLGV